MTPRYAMTLVLLLLCASLAGTVSADSPANTNKTQIAQDVYVYGYPLVLMDITKGQLTAVPKPGLRAAPVNQFVRATGTTTARFSMVVSPNVDTLYASAFLDLTKEPIVLGVPDTRGRYYLIPMLDSWSNVFASPGSRTTGTGAGNFLITGPGWNGPVPAGMSRIQAPTATVWLAGRTLVNSSDPADVAAGRAVQAQYTLTPLSEWGTNYTPPSDVPVDASVDLVTPPADQVAHMTAIQFYTRMARLLTDNPPPAPDAPIVKEMAGIGMVPGKSFDFNSTDEKTRAAFSQGAAGGLMTIVAAAHASNPVFASPNHWLIMNYSGSYGTRYMERAATAWTLIGANLPADTIYGQVRTDSEGIPLNGTSRYVIHFDPNRTPPVRGFWSITLYNNRQFLVNNSIGRYALGDRSPMTYNADGSLDIWVQNESPGGDRESNWLPAPADGFNLLLREYWPTDEILDGRWVPPAVVRMPKISSAPGILAVPARSTAPQQTTEQSPLTEGVALTGLATAIIFFGKRR